jgi:DNA invertase Pin-like site-specific DNA recombinase
LLCPNCHSQTATYAGRKVKDTFKQKAKKSRPRKVNYDDVSRRVTDLGNLSAVAREFNITETAVRKIMKKTTLSHSGVV